MDAAHPSGFEPKQAIASLALTRPNWLESQPRDPKLLWLDKNENHDPELRALTSTVLQSLDPLSLMTYPECRHLYLKLASSLGVPPECLLFTAGSDGAIRAVFDTFVSPGDTVLHTSPTFAMYFVYCKIYGAKELLLEYRPHAAGPKLDLESILTALKTHRPRLCCLPNPDSPTGTVFTSDEIVQIIEVAQSCGSLVLIDEAYHPFYKPSVIGYTNVFANLVVARTFAKAWGLAGLRFGYLLANPTLAGFLRKGRPMYEVNTVGVHFMERMLDHEEEMLASVARLNAGKEDFLQAMTALGLNTLQGEGNFLHVAFGKFQQAVFRDLEDVVLFRRDFAEPCLQGYSRFSAATTAQFQPVIAAIRAAVHGHS